MVLEHLLSVANATLHPMLFGACDHGYGTRDVAPILYPILIVQRTVSVASCSLARIPVGDWVVLCALIWIAVSFYRWSRKPPSLILPMEKVSVASRIEQTDSYCAIVYQLLVAPEYRSSVSFVETFLFRASYVTQGCYVADIVNPAAALIAADTTGLLQNASLGYGAFARLEYGKINHVCRVDREKDMDDDAWQRCVDAWYTAMSSLRMVTVMKHEAFIVRVVAYGPRWTGDGLMLSHLDTFSLPSEIQSQ